ncbi:MAG: type I pullulanase [Clostridia bacterium]|nr:type I pullulanase [Clostridia bacterium]
MRSRRWLTAALAILLALCMLPIGCEPTVPQATEQPTEQPAVSTQAEATPEPTPEPAPEPVDEGPDDVAIQLVPAGNVIAQYTKDEVDHASMPLAETTTVRLHYRRNDDDANDRSTYPAWNVWAWDMSNGGNGAAYEFTGYDDYGVYADLDLSIIGEGKPVSLLGFLVRTDNWAKDPDGDRSIEVQPESPDGIQDVWVRTTESTVFYTQDNALKSIVSYALLSNDKTVSVYFKPLSNDFLPYATRFTVTINGEPYTNFTMGDYDKTLKRVNLELNDSIDLCDVVTVAYRFDPTWINQVGLMQTNYFDTEEFNEKYAYDGDDLGATFDNEEQPGVTTFKVWAPTSSSMELRLYRSGNPEEQKEPDRTVAMERGDKGVFAVSIPEDLDGWYYTYVVTNSKGTNEVVDPYAKSAGINGKRGMVVNFTKLNKMITGWDTDTRPFEGLPVDAVIYEAHVRDMTISETSGVPEQMRGKFIGLAQFDTTYTQDGVTVATGLSHLMELGVTHVQLQPFYDYSSVDETKSGNTLSATNYNWGYDPLNYNVLEGSYSTDPYDGYNRIIEFKQMVMAMHEAGISINMDVVYNHTSASENSNLNLLVPYYYYRTKANGAFYNGSGCGNEVASDRYMVNKFIRESCVFWTEEYHLSGFRFDLMGLLDNQTMIDVYNDCSAVYPSVMVYGEPWGGGTTKLKSGNDAGKLREQMTVQESLAQDYFSGSGVLVGAFNDVIRNAIRGDNNPGKGYVQGVSSDASLIAMCVSGVFSKGTVKSQNIDPNLVLNYASCHDNYTLFDQLVQTMNEDRLQNAYTQADAIVFLSQGVPFIQEGEEFMRSKLDPETGKYSGNSYNVGDFINVMDYSLKVEHYDVFEKTKELIAFRAANDAFRLATRQEITDRLGKAEAQKGNVHYSIGEYLVFHSAAGEAVELDGEYEIVYSNVRTEYGKVSGPFTVSVNESVVLREVN